MNIESVLFLTLALPPLALLKLPAQKEKQAGQVVAVRFTAVVILNRWLKFSREVKLKSHERYSSEEFQLHSQGHLIFIKTGKNVWLGRMGLYLMEREPPNNIGKLISKA